ncbi:MAG: GNAT family N-acetyltransferase [Bacilli bacterium]|nr:GNAT family N-acetyltransferase [Bacilli bacterium]
MDAIIREKRLEDCASVQKIITKSWQHTYRGIVNDVFLNSLTYNEEERIINSQKNFNSITNNELVLEINGRVVGFVKYSQADDLKYKDYGEINAIYILNEYKCMGYGKKLIKDAVKKLKHLGFDKMIIGCLEGNPANEFYKRLGGTLDSKRIFSRGGQDLVENVYVFHSIDI